MRAQTVEIFQVTLFTAMYYHLVRFSDGATQGAAGRGTTQALLATLFLGLLSLAKLVYFALFPLVIGYILVVTAHREWATWRESGWRCVPRLVRTHRRLLSVVGTASFLFFGLILLLNWHRFGSPWNTGYQQFASERSLFRTSLSGFWGYLADPQKSIFIYCPVLLLAFGGLWWMPRGRRGTYVFAWVSFIALYVISASFVNWRGDWCYGPRYLLFALPVLCLPAASLLSREWKLGAAKTVVIGGVLVVSLGSFNSLLSIHGSEFFAAFRARQCFTTFEDERATAEIADERVRAYFQQPHWRINRDLRRFRLGHLPFPPLELERGTLSPAEYHVKAESLRMVPLGNYYWPGQLGSQGNPEVTRNP